MEAPLVGKSAPKERPTKIPIEAIALKHHGGFTLIRYDDAIMTLSVLDGNG